MNRLKDLTGQRFGRWLVLERAPNHGPKTMWLCQCDCGRHGVVCGSSLLPTGNSRSCGCLQREEFGASRYVHGHAAGEKKSKEYRAWRHMITRCENPNSKDFSEYGGRGIRVCEAWRGSFVTFLNDVGLAPTPGHSIGRINNVLGYSPDNVRWETPSQQANNRRPRRRVA
jgi:hypothetical protein